MKRAALLLLALALPTALAYDTNYPWMAYIEGPSGPCGGSLVAPGYVLTAAQCVWSKGAAAAPGDVKAWVAGQDLVVESVLVNPAFSNFSGSDKSPPAWDVALLALAADSSAPYVSLPTSAIPKNGDWVKGLAWKSPKSSVEATDLVVWDGCPTAWWADELCLSGVMLAGACPADKGSPTLKGSLQVALTSGADCIDPASQYGYYEWLADKDVMEQLAVWLSSREGTPNSGIDDTVREWIRQADCYVNGLDPCPEAGGPVAAPPSPSPSPPPSPPASSPPPRPVGDANTNVLGNLTEGGTWDASLFPYLAEITTGWPAGTQSCGGSLIAPGYVLTAAQCVYGDSGPAKPSEVSVWIDGVTHIVETVLVATDDASAYDGFKSDKSQPSWDVAMLALAENSDAPYVSLPTWAAPSEGETVWSTAWQTPQASLLYENLTVEAPGACPDAWADLFCAASPLFLTSSCPSDKGSPALLSTDEGDYQVGLTSGPGCTGETYGYFLNITDKGIMQQITVWLQSREGTANPGLDDTIRKWIQDAYKYLYNY